MKNKFYTNLLVLLLAPFLFSGCGKKSAQEPENFNPETLNQVVYDTQENEYSIGEIVKNQASFTVLEVWASWCGDCVKSLPKVEYFQKKYPYVNFIFLSVDDSAEDWQNGIQKHFANHHINGEHYFFNTGWAKDSSNAFINWAKLDWIPRYILLDQNGKVLVYNAQSIDDEIFENFLKP